MADGERDKLIDSIEDQFDNEKVKSLIKEDNLFDAVYPSKNTLLHYAVEYENEDIVRYLVDAGSKLDTRNDDGQTPLTLALARNFIYNNAIVRILVEAGADIYSPEDSDENALTLVGNCEWASEDILRLFLQKVERDCSNNKERVTALLIDSRWSLHKFVLLWDVELTRIALERGFKNNINDTDYVGNTVLHVAVRNVDVEHVSLLLEYDVNVNAVEFLDPRQRTPLSYVYDSNSEEHPNERFEILTMLLDRGAVLTFNYWNNERGVFDIFRYGSSESIDLLLQSTNVDLSITDSRANTVVHALATNKNTGAIQQIRGRTIDVNSPNRNGMTPLMTAVIEGNIRAIDLLTMLDADTELADKDGRTTLYIAVEKSQWREHEYRECVQMLLERGADAQVEIYSSRPTILEVLLEQESMVISEIVIAHLAWEEALGTPLTELVRYRINEERRFRRYFEACGRLLSTDICESVRLLDLMTGSDEIIESYVGNEEFMLRFRRFIDEVCDSYFYFVAVLEKRLWKPIYVSALRREAARFVCKILGIGYNGYANIADEIISYFEQQDIEKFLDTTFKKSHYSEFHYTDVKSCWKF